MIPNDRRHVARPTSPGEILLEEFLKPMKMTQQQLAERMGVGVQTVNLIVNGKRAITAETALRLELVFGTSAQFWLNGQMAVDLWDAEQKLGTKERAAIAKARGKSRRAAAEPADGHR